MNLGIMFVIIAVIIIIILQYNNHFSSKKFINETAPYFRFLMEDDYKFLLNIRYGDDIDVNKLFGQRVRNGIIAIVFMIFVFLSKLSPLFLYFLIITLTFINVKKISPVFYR